MSEEESKLRLKHLTMLLQGLDGVQILDQEAYIVSLLIPAEKRLDFQKAILAQQCQKLGISLELLAAISAVKK